MLEIYSISWRPKSSKTKSFVTSVSKYIKGFCKIRLRHNEEEKNEILQLYERMRRENEERKKECENLRDLLYKVVNSQEN